MNTRLPALSAWTALVTAIVITGGTLSFAPVVQAQEPPPGASTPIPDGYIRTQAPPEWRGQTTDWYLAQAQLIYAEYVADLTNDPTGVAIVDRDEGGILAQFDAATLSAQ